MTCGVSLSIAVADAQDKGVSAPGETAAAGGVPYLVVDQGVQEIQSGGCQSSTRG